MRKFHLGNGRTGSGVKRALAVLVCLVVVATYSIGTLPVYGEEVDVDGQVQQVQSQISSDENGGG